MADVLDKIRARWAATTPGPWQLCPEGIYILGPRCEMVADMRDDGNVARIRGVGAGLPRAANGEAIAAAPSDIATLLKRVDELERDVKAGRPVRALGRAVRKALGEGGARTIWYAIHAVMDSRQRSINEHGGSVGSAMVVRSCDDAIAALTRVAEAVAKDREVAR